MHAKLYTMRGSAVENGRNTDIEVDLEFDGARAFVIWDSITIGDLELKARVEIDPQLLRPLVQSDCDYLYCGELILPRPENN